MNTIAQPATAPVRKTTTFTYLLAALAGLMFGLDIGVISGAEKLIQAQFGISDSYIEWIVSSMMLGATIGAAVAGWISSRLGRKRALIISAFLFVVGSLFCAAAWSPAVLVGARLLLGLAIGVAAFTAPMYLAEVAPQKIRGAMISTYQLMITIGILGAFLSNTGFSYSGNWRWMLGVIAIPGLLFFFGVMLLPESPRWLVMRGRSDDARKVLRKLRTSEASVDSEVGEIEAQLKIPQRGWDLFFSNSNFRRSVGLGVMLQIVQQLTGINVLMYYAPRIFEHVGFVGSAGMWTTVILGATNVLATFIAIAFVDRIGRKPILYAGFVVMAIGWGSVGVMMHLGIHTTGEQIFSVAMLLLFVVGFAMSAGPLVWAICSEIQPLKGRDFGIGVSTVTNWVVNFIVGVTFLSLINWIGTAATFGLFASLNAIFLIFTFFLIPETKDVSLEEIERNLMAGKPLREIGA
ncbi:sugar porter family MFS transporter [Oleiagrimonas sp.]|jgi:SP family galactose:H+ symporter-like MFS transporter|uniref:sugar porter family MFS transporter n=1 Tax=Oleiagrimonas sp. TaxID=2010330 RepID=UPI0026363FFF|nr:sugar porter family MFS transporter [Oleiagrimonas sp.]MDA3914741.1 sugar porter family MFS transporter [Oleiagrimonas sp.]